ncbi:hypothetical protein MIND_01009800 [Mycena indigotica]|uniref:C2H2-type domain-containing protein n=1 Tax=Mycena indigotica TaxID=2126181 RepID=A0A8H6S8C4_9AGAR|nr:uncharacterized protein MIND_01009800 [Mycena indigotica]KAF7294724.1 hypothetical protein MIND_01009800 [Mycena indigotica]
MSSSFDVKYCSLCDAYFYSQEMLQAHISSSRRHPKCLACNKSFLNNNSLRNHFVLSPKHHYCRICQKHFKAASGLRIHLDFAHDESDEEDDLRPEGWEDEQAYEEDLALSGNEIPIPEEELNALSIGRSNLVEWPDPTIGALRLRCPICLSHRSDMSATRCGHIFCSASVLSPFSIKHNLMNKSAALLTFSKTQNGVPLVVNLRSQLSCALCL